MKVVLRESAEGMGHLPSEKASGGQEGGCDGAVAGGSGSP